MKAMTVSRYLLFTILFAGNFSCANAQLNKEQEMKATFQRIVLALQSKDTSKINACLEKDHNPYDRPEDIELIRDCKFISKIIDTYGMPKSDSIKITKGQMGENIVYATLMQKDDSLLNLKKFEVAVIFYPDQFLKDTDKILAYRFNKIPYKKPEFKLIKADPLPPLNNR